MFWYGKQKLSKSKINLHLNFLKTMSNETLSIPAAQLDIAVFKNTKKRDGKKDPDYSGVITIGEKGKEQKFRVVMWANQSKKGLKYMSGKADFSKPMEEAKKEGSTTPDDDLPF